jgi:hypothetical protein
VLPREELEEECAVDGEVAADAETDASEQGFKTND